MQISNKAKTIIISIFIILVVNYSYIMSLKGQNVALEIQLKEVTIQKELLKKDLVESLQEAVKNNQAVEVKNAPKRGAVKINKETVAIACSPSKNEEVNRLLNKYFKDCKTVKIMWSIAQAESRGRQLEINKNNRNGSWDCGWLQVNTIHRGKGESYQSFCDRMHNLEENIKLASKIYNDNKKITGDGFTAWVTYNNDKHLAYLK